MQPNQQPPIYSVDYLNQIAPKAPKKQLFTRMHLIVAGGLSVLIIGIIVIGLVASGSSTSGPSQTLAARLITTETIVGDSQANLKSTELRTLNSNLKIYLTNTNRDIVAPLTKTGVNASKIDPKILAKESGTVITDRLEDARLNAVFDRTYAREIAFQLEKIVVLMRQLYDSTNDASLKSFLEGAYTNLEPTQQAFSAFNAANG